MPMARCAGFAPTPRWAWCTTSPHDSDFVALRTLPAFDSVLKQVDHNRRPIASSTIAMRLPASGLITEDIAYDPETNLFFVSSVREGKVLAIDERGVVRDFIRSGQDGLWSIFALAVDVNRHVLWLTTAAVPQNRRYQPADSGRTAVVQYDIPHRTTPGPGRLCVAMATITCWGT